MRLFESELAIDRGLFAAVDVVRVRHHLTASTSPPMPLFVVLALAVEFLKISEVSHRPDALDMIHE